MTTGEDYIIPKVIHYCWFGGNPLPSSVKQCIKSWKTYCPDYEIMEWNEDNFDVNVHPFMKAAYEAKAWAFVSDYARLKVVYEHGGIYLDTDVELLKSLDELRKNTCYIGIQNGGLCNTGLGFGATKANPVVKEMLGVYDGLEFDNDKRDILACPGLNNSVIIRKGYKVSDEVVNLPGVTVYPKRYFDPISTVDAYDLTCEDTFSIHHYEGSWCGMGRYYKKRLMHFIGEKNVVTIRKLLRKIK